MSSSRTSIRIDPPPLVVVGSAQDHLACLLALEMSIPRAVFLALRLGVDLRVQVTFTDAHGELISSAPIVPVAIPGGFVVSPYVPGDMARRHPEPIRVDASIDGWTARGLVPVETTAVLLTLRCAEVA